MRRVIDKVIVTRASGRWTWRAVDKTGRRIGGGHKAFTRLTNALRNIETVTGCSTEILTRLKDRRYRVAQWGREFVIEVED